MNNNDDDRPNMTNKSHSDQPPGFDSDNTGGGPAKESRQEPIFTGFDETEDDDYEEPDRDTDYASGYHTESADDVFDDNLLEEEDVIPAEETSGKEDDRYDSWEEEEEDILWSEPVPTGTGADSDTYAETDEQDQWETTAEQEPDTQYLTADASDDDDEQWPEDEDNAAQDDNEWIPEEEDPGQNDGDPRNWPLGLIIVAIVALLLLAAGGYGVIQQRTATQEEIRQLQASLATAASPAEVSASRGAVRDMEARNTELTQAVDGLTLENRRLADTVAGLESQLEAQQAAAVTQAAQQATKVASATKPAAAKPATPQATTSEPATTGSGGAAWFVNFGSYSKRPIAESWAGKLKPKTGNVVVTNGVKGGQTFYRVRVIALPSRESAEKIARQLESEYGLSKLWVGRQ
jgi:cell division septation protein DedD